MSISRHPDRRGRASVLALALGMALAAPVAAHEVPAAAAPATMQSAPQSPASRALHAFFEEEWERGLRESPEGASYTGDSRFDDRWTDASLEAVAAREAADRAALARLRAIDRESLPPADQLSYDVFLWQAERGVERQRFREWQRPVS